MQQFFKVEVPKAIFMWALLLALTTLAGVTGATAWLNGTESGQQFKATYELVAQIDITVLQESPRAFEGLIVLGDTLANNPEMLEDFHTWLKLEIAR